MKNLILFAFLILFFFNHPVKSQKGNTWLKYYAYVDTAEIAIVDSTYTKALVYYETAFKLVDHPFGKDYYNAVLCADHLGKNKEAIFYMGKLAEKGLDIKYFEDNPFLYNIKKSKDWQKFIASYPDLRKTYLKNTNFALRKEFEAMYARDQYYVNKNHDAPRYRDSVFFITYENIRRFIEIVDQSGFPDENMIGLTGLPYDAPYLLLLVHFQEGIPNFNHAKFKTSKQACIERGMDWNKIDLISILKKAVWEGKLHPNSLVNINLPSNKYGHTILIQVDDTVAQINYTDSLKMKIDSARKDIGLCNLEMHRQKGLFSLYKIEHFRGKIKNEAPKEYIGYLGSYKTASEKNFTFGLGGIYRNYFFRDGDPQHKHFLKILKGLTDDFNNE